MRRAISRSMFLACALIFASSALFAAERMNWKVKIYRKTRDSFVKIKVVKPTSRKDDISTGVIIDNRGYIVTNNHVVSNFTQIKVYHRDGTYLKCTNCQQIPSHDLAVLKVETEKKLQALSLGGAGELWPGEDVLAIGHPHGYSNSISSGEISAINREIVMPTGVALTNLIQTTAAINPGNSGGPLLNVHGQLIGINVAIRKGAQSIAFSLNADTVQKVLSRHLSAKKVSGVRHGMYCLETVKENEGRISQKVVVAEVSSSTVAATAGLKKGDVILSVNNRQILNRFDIERSLWKVGVNTIPIRIKREGAVKTLSLDLRMVRSFARR